MCARRVPYIRAILRTLQAGIWNNRHDRHVLCCGFLLSSTVTRGNRYMEVETVAVCLKVHAMRKVCDRINIIAFVMLRVLEMLK